MAGTAPAGAAVWEDEADVDLDPRIGPYWMLPGTQREVPTPGKTRDALYSRHGVGRPT